MRKKIVILTLVAMLVLTVVSPVLAAGAQATGNGKGAGQGGNAGQGQPSRQQHRHTERNVPEDLPGRQYFTLVGVISDLTSDAITVQVHNGNRFVKPFAGDSLTVELTAGTVYRRWTPAGCVEIPFEEVDLGDTTSIHGSVSEGVFLAERVTVDVPLDCCTP